MKRLDSARFNAVLNSELLSWLLENSANLAFECFHACGADLAGDNLPVAIDEKRMGDGIALVRLAKHRPAADEDRVEQFFFPREVLYPSGRFAMVPRIDREDLQTLLGILLMQGLEVRNLRTAGRSPDAPEGKQDGLPTILRERDLVAGEVFERKVRCCFAGHV